MKGAEFFNKLDKIMEKCDILRWLDIQDRYADRFKDDKVKGIYYVKDRDCWRVQISIDGIRKHVGEYKNKIDAIHAYRKYLKDNNL